MKVPCEHCGKQLDENSRFTLQKVTAYESKGQGGSRRGGSDLVARQHLREWACHQCVDRLKRKVAPLQQSLGAA